jgi:hypothetical protein
MKKSLSNLRARLSGSRSNSKEEITQADAPIASGSNSNSKEELVQTDASGSNEENKEGATTPDKHYHKHHRPHIPSFLHSSKEDLPVAPIGPFLKYGGTSGGSWQGTLLLVLPASGITSGLMK